MFVRRMFNLPTWNYASPFAELERMRNQMDQIFEGLSGATTKTAGAGVFPLVNISEDADAYRVRAELPGIRAEELDIQITGKNLSISGERQILEAGQNAKYHRREREAGRFRRMITTPGPVNVEKVAASCNDGILTVVLPKAEEAKPKQITVR